MTDEERNMKQAILLGWINKGKVADCGETVKNQLLIKGLEDRGVKCYLCDFKNWKKHPYVIIEFLMDLIIHREATLILSTSAKNIYGLLKFLKAIGWKQNIVHWVIGGTLGQKVQDKIYDPSVIGFANHTLVESKYMVKQLTETNVKGVKQVPNFKPINYYPVLQTKYPRNNNKLRLVFLSRIMPEKGCDYIIEASNKLNKKNFGNSYEIDFYGRIKDEYEKDFMTQIANIPNVNYKGFLNFNNTNAYDQLSSYDLMLFPTFWRGEGFAGVFIDAFIAGVPIIATDWAHNKAILEEGKNALFIKPRDAIQLADTIERCIKGDYNLDKMSAYSQKEAEKYNVDNVITEDLLKEIGIL